MKKQLRLFTVLLLALLGGVNVWAADVTDTWTASSGALGTAEGSGTITTTGGKSWDYTRTLISGDSYTGWGSGCIQLGKNGGVENLTLSTTAYGTNTIKAVSVECASYQSKHNVSITVGGTTYLEATPTAKWTTVSAAEGTGTSSGEIVISFTDGERALYIKSITVVYDDPNVTPDDRTPVTLSFPYASYDATVGVAFYAPTATASPAVSPITYSSSDTGIAIVDEETGEITLLDKGTAIITASFAGDEEYQPAEASYTLNVTKQTEVEDGFFNFEDKTLDYGSGIALTSDGQYYELEASTWEAGKVTLVASGKYRRWNDGTLRFYNNDPQSAMTISVPEGYVITQIAVTGGQKWAANVGTYTESTGKWVGQSQSVALTYNASSGGVNVKTVTVTYEEGVSLIDPELTYSASTASAEVGYEFDAPDLSVVQGFTGSEAIEFSSSNTDVAEIDEQGVVTIKGAGTTVIKAEFAGDDTYSASSASYTLTVTDPNAPGSENNPYTVAQAIAVINGLEANQPTDYVYVTGKIAQIDEVNLTYGNATYLISDDGTTDSFLQVYRGYYLGNVKFESADQIAVGDEVKVVGKLMKYYSSTSGVTPEITNGYLVNLTHNTPQPTGYKYMSFCSANNLDFTGKDMKAYLACGFISGKVLLTKIDKVPANTGIMISSPNEDLPGAFDETDYVTTDNISAYYLNMLVGVTEATTITPTYTIGGDEYTTFVLSKPKNKALGFYTISKNTNLGANRAYMLVLSSAVENAANGMEFEFIDDPDAVKGIENNTTDEGAWYTIQGVRVAQPTQSGVYIHNGHKVVVK